MRKARKAGDLSGTSDLKYNAFNSEQKRPKSIWRMPRISDSFILYEFATAAVYATREHEEPAFSKNGGHSNRCAIETASGGDSQASSFDEAYHAGSSPNG